MENTPPADTPPTGGSGLVTTAIGLAVAIVAIIFALNASASISNWYSIFKLVHVLVAVFWVGGGVVLTVLALRAERSRDPEEMATVARQAAFVGSRFFAPAGVIVLVMGLILVHKLHLGMGTTWVTIGLVGFVLSFITGIAFLGPQSKRVGKLMDEKGAAAAETQAAIHRLLLVARVDVGVLLLVVADMAMKPSF